MAASSAAEALGRAWDANTVRVLLHGIAALRRVQPSERTARRFVLGYYSCPHQDRPLTLSAHRPPSPPPFGPPSSQVGNRLHAFALAVVSGRTLLWDYCNPHSCTADTEQAVCDSVLQLRGWVPSSRLLEAWTGVARTPLRAVHVCGGGKRWNDSLTRPQLRTCGVDRLREPVVSFGVLERFGVLGWLAHAPLSPPARARYVGLMRFGEAPAYGALFERLFQLRMPFAASRALQALAASTVVLGVHARHRSQRDDGSNAISFTARLEAAMARAGCINATCSIVAASDRSAFFDAVSKWHAHRFENVSFSLPTLVIGSHARERGPLAEHGPFAGASALEDLELLSYAKDGVVGTARSSFSELARERAAWRAVLAREAQEESLSRPQEGGHSR